MGIWSGGEWAYGVVGNGHKEWWGMGIRCVSEQA